MRTFQIFGQHRICIFYVKSGRKQLQHNYVITLMVTRVSLKNFNQRINVITVLKPKEKNNNTAEKEICA